MLKRIMITEICFLALVGLYFFPLGEGLHEYILMHTLLGWVLVFFAVVYLPGYRRSYIFFGKDELKRYERIMVILALGVGLSLFTGLYLGVYFPNYILGGIALVSAIAIALGIIILLIKRQSGSSK